MPSRRERPEETSRSGNGLKKASRPRPASHVPRPDPKSGRENAARATASRQTRQPGRPARNGGPPLPHSVAAQPGRTSRIAPMARVQNRTIVSTRPGVAGAKRAARPTGKRAARPLRRLSEKIPREKISLKSPAGKISPRNPSGRNLPKHPTGDRTNRERNRPRNPGLVRRPMKAPNPGAVKGPRLHRPHPENP